MKSVTIGQKIAGGFAALILLALLLGGMTSFTMRSVQRAALQMSSEFVPEARVGSAISDAVSRAQITSRTYALTADEKYVAEFQANVGAIEREIAAARTLLESHPQLVKLREHLPGVDLALREYVAGMTETEARNRVIAAGREKLNAAAAVFTTAIDKIIASQHTHLDRELKAFSGADPVIERHRKLTLATEIRTLGDAVRLAVFKAQALRSPQIIAGAMGNFDSMTTAFAALKGLLKVPSDIEELDRTQRAAQAYQAAMKEIMASLLALDEIGQRRAAASYRLDDLATATSRGGMQRTIASAETTTTQLTRGLTTTFITLGIVVVLGAIVALVLVRGISRVLRSTTDALATGAEQIAAAAHQVSGSSQSLAAGASEQAASLEETSASIEEMSGTTKRNAQSAHQAKALAQSARAAADSSASSVAKLNTAMIELKSSSAEISKIVKTIDEIAFQTNILALNAAVEAARAGESGMGFAVVAEEVRSLAQRSAQAARETAGKIETALARSEDGARISVEVAGNLTGIIEQVRKLDGIVSEIADASSQQAQGIEQVNTAVSQMDRVTQSNAAAAEESASAAEEMNAQTDELNTLVGHLLALVGGRRATDHLGLPGAPLPGGRRKHDSTVAVKPQELSVVAPPAPAAAPATSDTRSFH